MGWVPANPSNDELLTNYPAQQRANNDAIELGTDASLLVTNAKVAAAAGIVDTKLAQIVTAAKVSGAALTLLANVPAGAGVLPSANSPCKLKADAGDTTPQYLDALLDTNVFQISAGDLLQLKDGGVETEKLESGAAAPGNSKYYGTNSDGTKGFFTLPEGVTDHGALSGLGDDDHPQYRKEADTAYVSQSKLKTASGELSRSDQSWENSQITLPGGEYGFYPQVKMSNTESHVWSAEIACFQGHAYPGHTSYRTRISLTTDNGTIYARQRYITASGRDHWIFLLVDKITKQIISGYQAPDHPSANQGGATELDIPHPFGSYDPAKHEIVVVDNSILNQLKLKLNRKNSLLTLINEQCIIDDTKRPKYEPREIIKINEFPDEPIGKVKARIKTPQWAKIMIQPEEITLEQRIIEKLPDNILFKKLALK